MWLPLQNSTYKIYLSDIRLSFFLNFIFYHLCHQVSCYFFNHNCPSLTMLPTTVPTISTGHCFVSLMLCIPVRNHDKISYLAVPLGYRMWHKTESKPELVASMVRQVMPEFSQKKNMMNEIYPIISALIPPEYRNQLI